MWDAGCEDTDRLDLTLEKGNVEENGGKNTGEKMAKRWGGSKEEMEDEIKKSREEMEEQALSYWVWFRKLGWISPIWSSQFLDINDNIEVYYKVP